LLATLFSGPSHGTLQLNLDGSFTYTPNTNYYGTDSFQYEVFDGTSYSSPATVTLTVTQDLPTASPGDYSVLPTGTTSYSADDGVLSSLPNNTPNWLTATLISSTSYGNLTLNSDGSFSYTPGSNFKGSDSFTYEAYNGLGYSSTATVTLASGPVDSAQTYSVNHDTPLIVDATVGLKLGAYDADGDTLTANLVGGPSHGTVTVNSDGSFTYTPNTHFVGTDSFTFTVSDGSQNAATATATINVTDDVPLAGDGDYGTQENQALFVGSGNGVLANAADDDGDSLTAQLVSGPSDGTLLFHSDGSFTYTPNPGFIGTDTFQYAATDGISTSAAAPVTIYVGESIPENQSGSTPSAVAVADFNNDGYPDVAMADSGLNKVSIYLDNSSGVVSTTPVSTITVGSSPVGIVAGNFGNGQQDLAVVNSGSNSVSILLGNGNGTFTVGQTLTGFNDPVAIVAGNFGNGQVDLAVVNKGSNTVSILLGNGNGTFTAGSTLTTGNSPTSIPAADFNNDGKLDLVMTNSASNTVSVFLGNGNATFQSGVTYAVGTTPMSVTTGDFNGDGNVDLAVANSGSNNVSLLFGNGDGTFQAATNYAVGSNPVSVVAGNFAGPAYPGIDLAVVSEGSNNLTVLSGISGAGVMNETTLSTAAGPRGMALGDFANNGQLQGVVVAMAAPGNGQLAFAAALAAAAPKLRTAAFFKVEALKAAGIPELQIANVSIETLDEGIAVNKKITAAYAQLFSENPNKYPWFGLAAFASNQVGQTIQFFTNLAKKADAITAKFDIAGAALLITGNQAVYKDIYWRFLAYAAGGLNQIKALGAGFVNAFPLIDSGVPNNIWFGNNLFFYHEQHDLLQPKVFDKINEYVPKIIAAGLSGMAEPVFPSSTSFLDALKAAGVLQPNLANSGQRWYVWIQGAPDPDSPIKPGKGQVGLWKQWQTYVGAWVQPNGIWRFGFLLNPLEQWMVIFIATGR
jgi:hypothetical protein